MHRSAVYLGDFLSALQATGAWKPGTPFPVHGLALSQIADACGLVLPPEPLQEVMSDTQPPEEPPKRQAQLQELPPARAAAKDGSPARERRLEFWHVAKKIERSVQELAQRRAPPAFLERAPETSNADWDFDWKPSPGRGLLSWKRLWPFLKSALGSQRRSQQIDVPCTVRKLALATPLRSFPVRRRPAWQSRAVLLLDHRTALGSFWDDYAWLVRRIERVRGSLGLSAVRALWTGPKLMDEGKKRPWRVGGTSSDTAILTLGDLCQYDRTNPEYQSWVGLGRQLRRRGFRPWALCPCPRDRWSPAMARAWSLACWDHGQRLPLARGSSGHSALPVLPQDESALLVHREGQLLSLLRLASPGILVERGLLRDLRLLLPEADAGTEYDACQSKDFPGTEGARQLQPSFQLALRRELMDTAKVPLPLFLQAVSLILAHHQHSQSVFGPQEWDGILDLATPEHLQAMEQAGLLHDGVWEAIRHHWEKLAAGLLRERYGEHQAAMLPFAGELAARLQERSLTSDSLARQAKEVIWRLNHPADDRLAAWVRAESLEFLSPEQPLKVQALTLHDGLQLDSSMEESAGNLGLIQGRRLSLGVAVEGQLPENAFRAEREWTANSLLTAEELGQARRITLDAGEQQLILEKQFRPAWASRMGYDRNGLWAESSAPFPFPKAFFRWTEFGNEGRFRWKMESLLSTEMEKTWRFWADEFGLAAEFVIGQVPFVLRWIPPGSFMMGSPEEEPGRSDDEGPQHRVTISKGFWMGETPVTQRQWEVVVQSAYFDTETGSAHRRRNIARKPSHFKGSPDLPVEMVSWADCGHFCGLLDSLLPDGPGFHLPTEAQWEFACRAGTVTAFNDGSDCTSPFGKDPALDKLGWFFDTSGQQSRPVREKEANKYGLYDMHGNLWEWCVDVWHSYLDGERTDPHYKGDDSAERVLRGGSWSDLAQFCRAGCRFRGHPNNQFRSLGLRLAAGQNVPREAKQNIIVGARARPHQ
jgi:formylglycine-generating enzyme required for sulfatase activity